MNIATAGPTLLALYVEQRRLLNLLAPDSPEPQRSEVERFLTDFAMTVLNGSNAVAGDQRLVSCCLVWNSQDQLTFGSGVAISDRLVLTAAHVWCDTKPDRVSLPVLNWLQRDAGGAARVVVDHAILGADCTTFAGKDLAILLLKDKLPNSIALPSLPVPNDLAQAKQTGVTLCGFGAGFTGNGTEFGAGLKRFADGVPLIAPASLPGLDPEFDAVNEFVAGGKGPDNMIHDTCEFDSGGPVYFARPDGTNVLIGVTSRGALGQIVCGHGSIYSRIDSMLPRIKKVASKWGVAL